ncbi:MAG TPA: LysR substrate-binding domain-containing protein, partial [Chthoniobacterales bacterium]
DLPTRKAIDRHLREARVRVRHAMEFDSVETVKRTVEIENAISIVPETAVRDEVAAGTLVALPVEHTPALARPLGVIVKKSALGLPVIREFLAMLEKFDLGGERSRSLG